MASKFWIKLYHEILDDPKMGKLTDRLWRRTMELFLLAGEKHNEGHLPTLSEMCWRLRISEDELIKDIDALEKIGIITFLKTGCVVTHFAERQRAATSAERVRRYRDRKQASNAVVTTRYKTSNEHVTNTVPDIDIDKDTEEKAAVAAPSTFPEWQKKLRDTPNKVPIILAMCEKLYPDNEKPTGGHVAGAAKALGGYGRLADLLWQHSSRPPTGNPVQFVQGVAKGNRRRQTGPDGRKLDVDGQPIRQWRDVRAQMAEEEKEISHADG